MARRSFIHDESGAAMIEMTIVAMLLFTLVLGFVDFGHAFYQWNAANKAVQVGARLASVSTPVAVGLPVQTTVPADTSLIGTPVPANIYHYRCTGAGTRTATVVGTCSCVIGNCGNLAFDKPAFDLIYFGDGGVCGNTPAASRPGMCDFFPGLEPGEVRIEYVATGLGYWTRPGGPVPTIRVSLVGVPFEFFFLSGLMGFGNITMPSMLSTATGEDLRSIF